MTVRQRWMWSALALLLVMLVALAPTALADGGTMTVVARGLNNPRGLDFGPSGLLYVAEAGMGGSGPCVPGPEGGQVCLGMSGSLSRIDLSRRVQERILTGLPSLAAPDGSAAIGPVDVSLFNEAQINVIIGLGADPAARAQFGQNGRWLGRLLQGRAYKGFEATADVAAYEGVANPDGSQPPDSNPYSVLAVPDKQIVADAGGNDLLQVDAKGVITTLAVFPDRQVPAPPFLGMPPGATIPMQAVPTSVVQGPDGAYYVGQLTGFPFPVGAANVYRVPAGGGAPTVYASGFTNIVDIAFGKDGSLYVLEIAKAGLLAPGEGLPVGALIRVAPNGTRTEIASEGLLAPGGVTVGPDGALYVTNMSILPGAGEVLRIQP